jgi:signal transduction histidine kinase
MFHQRSLKLAGLYLAIIMSISVGFSVGIYQLSSREFNPGVQQPGPGGPRGSGSIGKLPNMIREAIREERELEFQQAQAQLRTQLITVNLFILILAGLASYQLALRTLKPIEEANEALERFTADASHELRTPIAAMQSEIEVALMDPKLSTAKAKKILVSNLEELAKLTTLTTGLLQLAHHENGIHLQDEVPVDHIVIQAVKRVSKSAGQKQIKIDVPDTVNKTVRGNETSLIEALVIILDNAIKYSPAKTTVSFSIQLHKRSVDIDIADQGLGIKASDLPHIFDRFYRADTSRSKQQGEGYGIGLALAKHIVETHGGTITARSMVSQGSHFTISLPLL